MTRTFTKEILAYMSLVLISSGILAAVGIAANG
jgi:hypothetical protein